MGSDRSRDVYSNGGNLRAFFRPHTRHALNSVRNHAQVAAGADESLFDLANELHSAHPWCETTQIEDRVTYKLSRAVKRDVATPVGLVQFDPFAFQDITRGNDILFNSVPSQSDDWRVLEQQQRVANSAFLYQVDKSLLQVKRSRVVHPPQVNEIQDAKLHEFIV